jgi:hypothetical protein
VNFAPRSWEKRGAQFTEESFSVPCSEREHTRGQINNSMFKLPKIELRLCGAQAISLLPIR